MPSFYLLLLTLPALPSLPVYFPFPFDKQTPNPIFFKVRCLLEKHDFRYNIRN